MNFRNFGNEPPPWEGGNGCSRQPGSFPPARQTSLYSLTFEELQSTMGSVGKDFGSMNMDELLKNIWNAEESQTMVGFTSGAAQNGGVPGGHLQRQGSSLTLPRTLSQKTVDEVWRDMLKEYNSGLGELNLPQRQQTLGEMTLEEFLVKAGVAREETQITVKPNNNGVFGNLSNAQNNPGFGIGFTQVGQNLGVMEHTIPENSNQISFQPANTSLDVNRVRSNQQQLPSQQPQQQQQQQQIFPRQPTMAYGASMAIQGTAQLGSPGIRGGIVGISDPVMNGNLVQSAALQGGRMVGLGGGTVSSDGLGKSNGDTSSVSPVPYVFNGGLRGRRGSAVEKVVERRQRRMIKNRESAARSRARKQAYTMELEAEITNLKEKNEELRKKQVLEIMSMPRRVKKRSLKRTHTGPW